MKTNVLAGVWAYTVAAILLEVFVYYTASSAAMLTALIGGLAATQVAAIAAFYMGLKDEPGPVRVIILVALMFLSGLLIATVATLG